MAGDWIKFRQELTTNPKFLTMVNRLVYIDEDDKDANIGLLVYACGEENLGIGVLPPSNKNVTDKALRCVTEAALRDVTLCSLLRVWSSVNAHCRVSGNDAIMEPMSSVELDDIAGFLGFYDAMETAGWVADHSHNSLIFKNFLEYNEPACLRKKPQSNADRQRAYRARKQAELPPSNGSNGALRSVTKSNDREEKRREEKNILEEKENKQKKSRSPRFDPLKADLPYQTETFRKAWADWCDHRAGKRAPLTARAVELQFRLLKELGHDDAVRSIEQSIEGHWTRLVAPKQGFNGQAHNGRDTGGRVIAKPGKYDKFSAPRKSDVLEYPRAAAEATATGLADSA